MSEARASGEAGADFDLGQFHQVFFEEAAENLDRFEQLLLGLDLAAADDETLNAVFRCAHSIKGGAATFGFADVAELTHEMETLLDRLRRHELRPGAGTVDVLLAAGDALRAQLASHQGGGGEAPDTTALLDDIRALTAGRQPQRAEHAAPPEAEAPSAATLRQLELQVGPLDDPAQADGLAELFREIPDLGVIEPLDAGHAADGMRRFKVTTTSSDGELVDLFGFHVAKEQIALRPLGPGYGFHPGAPGAPEPETLANDPGYGFFDNAPG
ncbi:MAG TPA: Hpt domain-containing protein, partial [Burkholderiaceae bacterium]